MSLPKARRSRSRWWRRSGAGIGAIAGGGKGAAIGAGVGGLIGLADSMRRKGKEVEIPAGTRQVIRLERPLSVNSTSSVPDSAAAWGAPRFVFFKLCLTLGRREVYVDLTELFA